MTSLVQLFRYQSANYPSNVALEDRTAPDGGVLSQITYRELDELSSELSTQLREKGIGPKDVVPILTNRCPGAVVAILATLKLRACYVPIDLDTWSQERINGILKRVSPKIIVSTQSLFRNDSSYYDRVFYLSPSKLGIENRYRLYASLLTGTTNHDFSHPEDPAYIIFTSGTTGKPKGVVVSQSAISAFACEGGEVPFNFAAARGKRILLTLSIAFDACTGVMFSALCNGSTLILSSTSSLPIAAGACDTLPITPSVLVALGPAKNYPNVEKVFLGGESPSLSLAHQWRTPQRRLFNLYGPTETTVATLMGEWKPGQPVTIGWPISFGKAILLDESGNEADEGELLLGGSCLAIGYYKDEVLTHEAFVWRNGERYYKTKDFAKKTIDGFVFCGRKDSMLKNRGFLINIENEVEPALLATSNAKAAIAGAFEGQLIAFVTPKDTAEGLREKLLEQHSSFLVPDVVHGLDEFPNNANGKVDRNALMAMHRDLQQRGESVHEVFTDPVTAVRSAMSEALRISASSLKDDSSFRRLGGHSLAAVMLVTTLRNYNYETSVFNISTLDTITAIATSLKKSTLTVNAEDHENNDNSVVLATDMQTRMVQATIDHSYFNILKIGMTFDHGEDHNVIPRLRSAWKQLIQRHSILRTSFDLSQEQDIQVIHEDVPLIWDESQILEESWDSAVREAQTISPHKDDAFDEQNPKFLSSFRLLTVPGKRSRLIWTVHHSLVDGLSVNIVLSELARLLHEEKLPAAPQFSQISKAIHSMAGQQNRAKAKSFWARKLAELDPTPRLRLPKPMEETKPHLQSEQRHKLCIRMSELDDAARRYSATPATLIYGAWALLLSRYCESEHTVVGAAVSGRIPLVQGVEKVVGPLLTTLPLSITLPKAMTVSSLLSQIFNSLHELFDLQWTPNSLIHEATGRTGTSFFDTIVSILFDFPSQTSHGGDSTPPKNISFSGTTEAPLTLFLDSSDGRLETRFLYQESSLTSSTVTRMTGHLENILNALMHASPQEPANNISSRMMGTAEHQMLLNLLGNSDEPYSGPETLADAFEGVVKAHPECVAVECPKSSPIHCMTYRQLGESTSQVARKLVQSNVKSRDVVCIIADGSIHWLIAIMSVVRAGATYCPIDEKLPLERQKYIVSVCSPPVVLFPNATKRQQSPIFEGVESLDVETIMSNEEKIEPGAQFERQVRGEDLAVILFTSGSTGIPKAVQLQHQGILSLFAYPPARLYSGPGRRNAQMLSLGFDCCVKEVFASMCFGATLVLKNPADPIAHLSTVDALMGVPSLLTDLDPLDFPNLRTITLTGEAISPLLIRRWGPGRTFQNGYAPAECTLICTAHPLSADRPVTIGKPVPRMDIYILDKMLRPAPVGVSGEICLSGIQVTPGYRNNDEENRKRFLADPFRKGRRMFRTGDLGRRLENGEVEYIGRYDSQIKLRGFRLDLGDVETSIARLTRDAHNVAVTVGAGTLRAFVTPETVNTQELLQKIKLHLPEYSVPSKVTALKTLPLSRNGKVDREALAEMDDNDGAQDVEPLITETERTVAAAWADVLGRERPISALHGFFDLGGHSLLQIRVAQRLSKHWGIKVPLRVIIRHQVLRDLCTALDEYKRNQLDVVENTSLSLSAVERTENMLTSDLEKEFFINYALAPRSAALNMTFSCELHGPLDLDLLKDSFRQVLTSNDVFRSKYRFDGETVVRSFANTASITEIKASHHDVNDIISETIQRPLDPLKDSMVEMHLIKISQWKLALVIVMSHLVGDAFTLNRFLSELSATYAAHRDSDFQASGVLGQPLTYLDWASRTDDRPLDKTITDFWRDYFAGLPPSGFYPSRSLSYFGKTISWTLRPSLLKNLSALATEYSITMHHMALGAMFLSLQSIKRVQDMVIGAPLNSRTEVGTEEMLGLFLDRLPIRVYWPFDDPEATSLHDFFHMVRDQSQEAMSHSVPFRSLRPILGRHPELTNRVLDVVVTFHTKMETSARDLHFDDVTMRAIPVRPHTAKFPLMVEFTESAEWDGLRIDMEYDTNVIDEEVATRLEQALALVLEFLGQRRSIESILSVITSSGAQQENKPQNSQGLLSEELTNGVSDRPDMDERVNVVREAMAACLGVKRPDISCTRSFWELGAESLDALRLQDKCSRRGVQIRLIDIFTNPTAEHLALSSYY